MMLSNMDENVTQDYKIWQTAHKIVIVIRWRYIRSYDFLDGTGINASLSSHPNPFIDYFFFSHHLSTYWFLVTLLMLTGIGIFKKSYKPEIKIAALALSYLLFVAYSIVLLILYLFDILHIFTSLYLPYLLFLLYCNYFLMKLLITFYLYYL